ncbi:hypothetical protein BN7_1099 [Wickerhamomyces ciferrii]|uniref:Uncharacterized protein n=1 Tax=Wickerhamomyces ciferrii (strain ATCC 14091 / BCRC 22168 / CBS 111 / JCM 3599 / NBRC 0793 / NRRL Y-1031 F-60-10) TaxID=1206466 RepID=K0KKA4_WICCF|nr:uncharacterized protein BN7_1099 [Wickerhamomyces ciferrii]CCH41558.1 hypothetical protein BN7_1099 [Wickerhamomyces ciferrii]
MTIFKKAIRPLSPGDKAKVCVTILEQIQDHASNRRLLEAVLSTVDSQALSMNAINNLAQLVPKIEKSYNAITPVLQAKFAQVFKEHSSDELISKFISNEDAQCGKLLKHILIIMLLKSKRYSEASNIVHRSLQNRSKLSPITIELLVLHLCELNDVDEINKARIILGLAKTQAYPIHARTFSTLLTKAVQLNDYETCYKIQRNIRDRTYVDNGTLIKLAESLVHKGAYQMVWGIEKEIGRKKSFSPEFIERLNIAVVESVAVKEGFTKAWNKLKEIHQGQELFVVDYPYLIKSFVLIKDQDELNFFIHKELNVESDELKKFIINLIVKKMADSGEVKKMLLILKNSPTLRSYIRENVILQLIHGSLVLEDSTILKEVYDLVEELGMKFHEKKTVNLFISAFTGTEYSSYIPKVLDLVAIENFKLRYDINKKLKK